MTVLQHDPFTFIVVFALGASAVAVTASGGGDLPTPPGRPDENWKKYVKYVVAALAVVVVAGTVWYLWGPGGSGPVDPPPRSWVDSVVSVPVDPVQNALARVVELQKECLTDGLTEVVHQQSHRALKPAAVNKMVKMLHLAPTARDGLAEYVQNRLIETEPDQLARVLRAAHEGLARGEPASKVYADAVANLEQRHGARLLTFGREYRQRR